MLRYTFLALAFPLVASATDCRFHLRDAVGESASRASQPFRRELSRRLSTYDALTAEAAAIYSDVTQLQAALAAQQTRVTWVERVLAETFMAPISRRARDLMHLHAKVFERGRHADAATERVKDTRRRLENFVLDSLARQDERLQEIVFAWRDLQYALGTVDACLRQIDRAKECMVTVNVDSHGPWMAGEVPDFTARQFSDFMNVEYAKLNRDLRAVLPPAHNLGVRTGWDFPKVQERENIFVRLRRVRRLVVGLREDLRQLKAEFDDHLRPLLNQFIEERP